MVPEVRMCNAEQCFYNSDGRCCAHSITVGSDQPLCETFMQSSSHTDRCGQGEVGACHISRCVFNDNMFCHACDDIEVQASGEMAMCATYSEM
jgi:hypothetical protein